MRHIEIRRRRRSEKIYETGRSAGLSSLPAHILACRLSDDKANVADIVSPTLRAISSPENLKDAKRAARRIADAIETGETIGILTDYDVDGITSHAVLLECLKDLFGVGPALIQSYVGHRLKDGYGINEKIVERIVNSERIPAVLITADCGSSDQVGVETLTRMGSAVLISDHHLVPEQGPPAAAFATVNPLQRDCGYPDKTIAGCMVAWLLMSETRRELIHRGRLSSDAPKLSRVLDFVALGTIADCVSIATATNRAVVKSGLSLMNQRARPCWRAMAERLRKSNKSFTAEDLGFQIGPRINARSRMADPEAALRFLLSETDLEAHRWLDILDLDNEERRRVQRAMLSTAEVEAERQILEGRVSLVIYLPDGHAGVQGIVASRLAEKYGRPTIVMCRTESEDELTGSGRGIPAIHLRCALEFVAKRVPEAVLKFGGHKAAAGLTIKASMQAQVANEFERSVREQLQDVVPEPLIWTDGELPGELISVDTVNELEALQPYGREFEAPMFDNQFTVAAIRVIGSRPVHLLLDLRHSSGIVKGLWFNALEEEGMDPPIEVGESVHCVYSLGIDEYNGSVKPNILIRHLRVTGESEHCSDG